MALLSVENGVLRAGSGRRPSRWREIKLNRGFAREASVEAETSAGDPRDEAQRVSDRFEFDVADEGRLAFARCCRGTLMLLWAILAVFCIFP